MAADVEITLGCSPECIYSSVQTNLLFATEAGLLTRRVDSDCPFSTDLADLAGQLASRGITQGGVHREENTKNGPFNN